MTITGSVSIGEVGKPVEKRKVDPAPRLTHQIGSDSDFRSTVETWSMFLDTFHSRSIPTETRMWKLDNCVVLPPQMLLVTETGNLIKHSIRKQPIVERDHRTRHLSSGAIGQAFPYETFNDVGFALSSSQHENYFHWMIESLPRLDWARSEFGVFVVNRPCKTFQLESLNILNPHSNSFMEIQHATKFAELFFVETLAKTNVRLSPLIERFYRNYSFATSLGQRIYVSRSDASIRRVENEKELFDKVLRPKGFMFIVPGRHSVEEQATLFANAEIIVGPHGAGLSNLAFCKPEAKMIELLPSSFLEGTTCYAALSELFGLTYALYVATSTNNSLGPSANMTVNLAVFDSFLTEVMN